MKFRERLKENMPCKGRDWLVYLTSMALASLLCFFLRTVSDGDRHVPAIFILVVLLVSLMTDGYFYGILTAVSGVVLANFAFTYPYASVDFTLYGYPLTFFTMLAVSVAVCTLTARLKEQERLRREAEQEKVRANLLRAISHDLRTPLTAISGSISAVLDGDVQEEALRRELLEGARQDADWLYRMVENLLSITRISGDSVGKLNKREELLEEVLAEAVAKFKKYYPGIRVSVSVPGDAFFVPMDAVLVEQVLVNLMINAAVHGEASVITVDARVEGDFARIQVLDDGKGVDPGKLPHLFDGSHSFVHTSHADKRGSLGIGLSVCRTIVQAHGGEISAGNCLQGGACFAFSLPLGGFSNDDQR